MYLTFISHLKKLTNIPLHDTKKLLQLAQEIRDKNSKGMGSAWILKKVQELVGEGSFA